jgi:hypothetical protein
MKQKFNTNNDSIEQLLQKEADKYRMYPSDKVWDNIRVELHGKPKWPALLFTFISITVALTVITIINYPPQKFIVNNNVNTKQINHLDISHNTKQAISKSSLLVKVSLPKVSSLPFIADVYESTNDIKDQSINNSDILNSGKLNSTNQQYIYENKASQLNSMSFRKAKREINEQTIAALGDDIEITKEQPDSSNQSISSNNIIIENVATKSSEADAYLNQFKKGNLVAENTSTSKWKIQFYLTPSNSYRTLEDDKSRLSYTSNQADRQALGTNINDIVKHKPAVGGEFGVSFLYGLTKNFFIKSGLQFNVRQYGIDAYRTNGSASFAYVQNNQLNTITFQSAYSTKQGNGEIKLENQLYQISAPIGLQWDVVDGERWGLSAAATFQPTYTINKSVYVVSTDYKFYADGTSFFRRWNINSSTELCLTLKSKNIKWFMGPQIRYQQLPTYNDIYPIKEYRVDYGIKFGFTKTL